ncbi:hypothetical protein LSTR_LSTR007014, partial [Laodelphax striatellus]
IKFRKLEYLEHMRYQLLQVILQLKMLARRGVGKRRISWLKNLRVWYGLTTKELFRAAVDKVRIARMVANV